MRCTSCGTDNNDGQKFCRACGTPFEQQPAQNINIGMGANPNANMGMNPQPQMTQPMPQQMPVQNQMPMPVQTQTPKKSSAGKVVGIIVGVVVGIFVLLYVIGLGVINEDRLTGVYKCSLSAYDTNRGIYVAFNQDKTFKMADSSAEIRGTFTITKEEFNSDEMIKTYALNLRATYRNINGQVLTEAVEVPYAIAINDEGFAALMNAQTQTIYYCEKQK